MKLTPEYWRISLQLGYHNGHWLHSLLLSWDLCIFLFCLEFPDYPSPLSFLYLFLQLPGYHICPLFIALCC